MDPRLVTRLFSSLRIFRDDQGGQSLIIVALSMTVALGISGFSIDVATWYAKHHQDQIAVDAAALAGANCLANPGPKEPCKSHADVAGAQALAVQYAADNGVTIQPSQVSVDTKNDIVRVDATTTAPALFARFFGITKAHVSVGSGAAWKLGQGGCATTDSSTTDRSGCAAIYSQNPSCVTSDGLNIGTQGNGGGALHVTGILHSEGNMTLANSTQASGLTFNHCPPSTTGKLTATSSPMPSWPVDYTKSFLSCNSDTSEQGGCMEYSNQNVPNYCTYVSMTVGPNNPDNGFTFSTVNGKPQLPDSNAVYCSIGDVGTTWTDAQGNTHIVTASDPSTWNGPIRFETSYPPNPGQCNSSSGSYPSATFIGGDITATTPHGVLCIKPAQSDLLPSPPTVTVPNEAWTAQYGPQGSDPNRLLFYSNGTVDLRQKMYWLGDMFAPYGTIQLGSTGATSNGQGTGGGNYTSPSGLIEGQNVSDANVSLSLIGDGPAVPGSTSSSSSGSDSLVS